MNSNKFWNIELYDDNTCITRWGRVGDVGQSKSFPGVGLKFFETKCREKEKKGYLPQKTLEGVKSVSSSNVKNSSALAEIAKKQIEYTSPETQRLIEYLTKVNIHSIMSNTTMQYNTSNGTFSTPLGIVTKEAIDSARTLLSDLANLVVAQDWDNPGMSGILNNYLMLIPQDIGRTKPNPKVLYPDLSAIRRQNDILDALDASLQAVLSNNNTSDTQEEKLFEVKLIHVDDGKVIDYLKNKYLSSRKDMHMSSTLGIKTVYSVEIATMNKAYDNFGASLGNTMELWHGTKSSNLLSIMKGGFVIPPSNAPYCTGRAFGNGVYFSSISTKSLNYSNGYAPGQRYDGPESSTFMFWNEVAMGNVYMTKTSFSGLPPNGYNSTWAKPGVCTYIQNDEMIVYRTDQIKPLYLIEFSRNK